MREYNDSNGTKDLLDFVPLLVVGLSGTEVIPSSSSWETGVEDNRLEIEVDAADSSPSVIKREHETFILKIALPFLP